MKKNVIVVKHGNHLRLIDVQIESVKRFSLMKVKNVTNVVKTSKKPVYTVSKQLMVPQRIGKMIQTGLIHIFYLYHFVNSVDKEKINLKLCLSD